MNASSMNNTTKFVCIVTILVFELVGICFIGFSCYKKKVCAVKTFGIVTELETIIEHYNNDVGERVITLYRPIIEYNVGTSTLLGKSNRGTESRPFQIGDKVNIYYNPLNPKQFYIEGYDLGAGNVMMGMVFMAIGIFLGIITIWMAKP